MTRIVHNLAPTDAAYIAGLVDGEGTITLVRRHRNENRQLEISVASTEFELLDYLLETIGAGRISRKRMIAHHHTPSGVYAISNRQALALLQQIYQYLRSYKRSRASLILKRYVALTPRNGYYTDELRKQRAVFEARFLAIKPS